MRYSKSGYLIFSLAVASGMLLEPVDIVFAQSVVVDGSTSTSVTHNADGSQTVGIAGKTGNSVSINRYKEFSVNPAGVKLDNGRVGARTIVNEVTSGSKSVLKGALEVLGSKADVIIANPNGIAVDGGKFINTSNVGLITAPITLDSSGRVAASVRKGSVSIGPNGLSGTMRELDLVAKSIDVDGSITNHDAAGKINLHSGDSDVVFDPDREYPDVFPWARASRAGGSNPGAVSIDISGNSTLGAGKINITVTDAGAGVRVAGDAMASVGDFTVTADGKLETRGAKIKAAKSVVAHVGSVELNSAERQTTVKADTGGIYIEAARGDIDLADSKLEGKSVVDTIFASSGVTLLAKGDIRQDGSKTGHQSSITSTSENIELSSKGKIDLRSTSITSGRSISMEALSDVNFSQTNLSAEDNLSVSSQGTLSAYSAQSTSGNASLAGSSVTFGVDENARENTRTKFVTRTGGMIINATNGDFINQGSLIQAANTLNGYENAEGALTLKVTGDLINETLDGEHLAVLFADKDDLSLNVGGSIHNKNGALLSNAKLRILAAHGLINETVLTGGNGRAVYAKARGGRSASTLWLKRSSGYSASANYGHLLVNGELGQILGSVGVDIKAESISNIGGNISGGNVEIAADDLFLSQAILTGSFSYKRKCRLFCSSRGHSNVGIVGGTINATGGMDSEFNVLDGDLSITAGRGIETLSGQLTAAGDATFVAPSIKSAYHVTPLVFGRPSGIGGLFRGARMWFGTSSNGTVWSAGQTLKFTGNISFAGAERYWGRKEEVEGDVSIEEIARDSVFIGRDDIGLFWTLF